MALNQTLSTAATYANRALVERFESRVPQMLEELAALTDIESPSNSNDALGTCARYLSSLGKTLLGFAPERIEIDGRVHLLWKFGATPRIVLVGHYDTVHPLGTVLDFPFSVDGDVVRGPGVCDMKSGVIIAMQVLRDLLDNFGSDALDGVCLFLNADEELGSPTSAPCIKELAQTTKFAIGFESAIDWQIKTSRRGTSHYEIIIEGRSAHAGDFTADGINALREMCAQADAIDALADAAAGTSLTLTFAQAGTTTNTVAGHASMWVDVRTNTPDEQQRVDREIKLLQPRLTNAVVRVEGKIEQPPLPDSSSKRLFAVAAEVAQDLGFPALQGRPAGGAADTCLFAREGAEAIDGFGAVGGGDHSDSEWIYVNSLAHQAALAAGLIAGLLRD